MAELQSNSGLRLVGCVYTVCMLQTLICSLKGLKWTPVGKCLRLFYAVCTLACIAICVRYYSSDCCEDI